MVYQFSTLSSLCVEVFIYVVIFYSYIVTQVDGHMTNQINAASFSELPEVLQTRIEDVHVGLVSV